MAIVKFLILATFSQIVWTQQFPGAWGPAGCWLDNTGLRTIDAASFFDPTFTTQEACVKFCNQRGYRYAGVEFSDECYCDNDIGNGATQQASSGCNINCAGNQSEICGGALRLTLFQNNVPPFVPLVDETEEFFYQGSFNDAPPNVEPFTFTTAPAGIVPPTSDVDGCAAWCKASSGNTIGLKEGGQICACGRIANSSALNPNRVLSQAGTELCLQNANQFCGDQNIMSTPAIVSPSFSTAHRLYVKSLYKRFLVNSLNWTIRRDLWRPRALEIRAEFERHRNVKDPRALAVLFESAEAYLATYRHPDPYIPAAFPGGTKWERNTPPRMGPIFDHHSVESEEGAITVNH